MYREVANLILYRELPEDSILRRIAGIIEDFDKGDEDAAELTTRVYREVKRLLDLATTYGFDENLWQNYLAYIIITNENSFSLTCEKLGAGDGSVNSFAKNDFRIFRKLFHYDFSPLEEALGIDCFKTLTQYRAIEKTERMYYRSVSEKVRSISRAIAAAADEEEIFRIVTAFYEKYGVGMFGLNKAFRIVSFPDRPGNIEFLAINNTDTVMLNDLVGYEIQKQKLIDNTESFVQGRKANNVLLFGDSGTGKSTCIKAILNQYYDQGLRMIEIYKHQFKDLSEIIARIKNRNYRFIIYMDDLYFEEFETEYKFLKAVIEGGVETKPDNILIYATSNRRHIIRELWSDRDDVNQQDGMHQSDTMQEKLSLVNRFGVTISFSAPSQKEFFEIVKVLAAREPSITLSQEELLAEANKWELSHGGLSGRTAQQFINHLAGRSGSEA